MSAPDTNIKKQKRWHRAPLIGMAVVVLFGVAMIFFWLMHEIANSNPPENPAALPQTTPGVTPSTTSP